MGTNPFCNDAKCGIEKRSLSTHEATYRIINNRLAMFKDLYEYEDCDAKLDLNKNIVPLSWKSHWLWKMSTDDKFSWTYESKIHSNTQRFSGEDSKLESEEVLKPKQTDDNQSQNLVRISSAGTHSLRWYFLLNFTFTSFYCYKFSSFWACEVKSCISYSN